MKKLLLSLSLLASGCAAVAHAQVALQGSTVNASVSMTTPLILSNFSEVNGFPSAGVALTSLGYTAWGKNATGDMDFIATNAGAAPTFYWWYATGVGPTFTIPMFLDSSENLHVPLGSINSLTYHATQFIINATYTVATIPAAGTVGAGGTVIVTDCTSFTPGPLASSCGSGGGSDSMIAISNGSTYSVH
jgi:hypothetical protein